MNVRENNMHTTAYLVEGAAYNHFLGQTFTFRSDVVFFVLHTNWRSKSQWISYVILNHQ